MSYQYRIKYATRHGLEVQIGLLYSPSGALIGTVSALSSYGVLTALRNLARKQTKGR